MSNQKNDSDEKKGQSITITNSTVGDVNQVAANTITNSFNKVAQAEAPDELKEQLKKLHEEVKEMLQHLPEKKQKQAAQDLKTLSDEALSEEPRRAWYELSAKGLMDAAQAVGEIALPVITTAKAVLAFLAGG
jgi:hypothetical protein